MPARFITSCPLDTVFMTCNHRSQLSLYDFAFNNISFDFRQKHLMSRGSPSGPPITSGCSIQRMQFISSQMAILLIVDRTKNVATDQLSLPSCRLVLLSFPYALTFQRIIHEYLQKEKFTEALDMLRIINWNCAHDTAYICLNDIFQHLLQLPFNETLVPLMESTLATFLVPCTPIDYKTFETTLPFIRHLAIRFFHHLIQHGCTLKAYQLAIELKSRRLFLLLHELAKQRDDEELARKCVAHISQLQ